MTRETKIGLLVGLAFIIVIGILLSDQLMRSTEPPAAPLASVADTLRKGTVTPAPARPPVAQVQAQQDVSPETAVPTRDDITRRPPPVSFVEVRPGGSGAAPVSNGGDVVIGPGNGGAAQRDAAGPGQIPIAPVGGAGRAIGLVGAEGASVAQRGQQNIVPIRTQSPDATAGRSLADVAAAAGETLIGADGQPLRATRTPQNTAQQKQHSTQQQQNATAAKPRPAGAAVGVKLYTAEPGDSLSKIAARQMGANTKANRDAIVRANPALSDDPNKIIVGQSYNIPLAAGQNAQAQSTAPAERVERTERAAAPIKASGGEFWYEVKPGDNLWKIAKTQLGDSGTVHAIKELNKESVKNWDVLPAGTRIKLPARPLASVQ
jgi:nucleoid-associated protein YgaU